MNFRTAVMLVVGFALLGLTPARAEAVAGDAYVLMIHATFEPRSHQAVDGAETGVVRVDQAKTGTTYAPGAAAATREGKGVEDRYVVFHAIPYLAATVKPVVVEKPYLDLDQVDGTGEIGVKPNLPADPQRICHVETSWAGHEGPVDACTVYRIPVAYFSGQPVVTVSLHFEDASGHREIFHSFPAHFLLHMAIEDAPIDLTVVAETMTSPTPIVVEHDYLPDRPGMPTAWRCATALSSAL